MPPQLTLKSLLGLGYRISVEDGRLQCVPPKGANQKLAIDKQLIARQISKLLPYDVYQYVSFSTGRFLGASSGLALQFIDINRGTSAYSIFNVELKRDRTTKHGKKGDRLPGKQFRITKRRNFYGFWLRMNLPMPPRLSSFHEYMGNLKPLLFVFARVDNERVQNGDISLLELDHETLRRLALEPADKTTTKNLQETDIRPTRFTDSDLDVTHEASGVQPISTTGGRNCGTRNQGSELQGDSYSSSKTPEQQTCEEWLEAYESEKPHV